MTVSYNRILRVISVNCVCHSIRSMFRVLGMYNFGVGVGIILKVEIKGSNDLPKTGVGEGMTPLPLSSDGLGICMYHV